MLQRYGPLLQDFSACGKDSVIIGDLVGSLSAKIFGYVQDSMLIFLKVKDI